MLRSAPRRVAIFGAGMGGLACAHELAKLGFSIDVYEASSSVGGKAKSQSVLGTGTGGRRDLPGEHGFRFYPRFYRHVIASMDEIPDPLSPTGRVSGNLVGTTETAVGLGADAGLLVGPRHPKDLFGSLDLFRRSGVTPVDMWRYLAVHLKFLTACEERRCAEYEPLSWLEFLRADDPARYSPRYRDIIVSVTRTMVAMDAKRGSARTIGTASALLLLDPAYSKGSDLDRTMTGPTSEVWLEPWREHLERQGVRFHFGAALSELACRDGMIVGATVVRVSHDDSIDVVADEYVAAVPIEVLRPILHRAPALIEAEPALAKIAGSDLEELTAWMLGAQFFLERDVPICEGHAFFPGTPWALTAISQAQFWNRGARNMSQYGDGRLRGIISVDISDAFAEDDRGLMLAHAKTRDEALDSIWRQLMNGFGKDARAFDDNVFARHLDDGVRFGERGAENSSRLLVHPPGSLAMRPPAALAVDNLTLAADYVATGVDLASMEGANEAGRCAARAIAGRAGLDPSTIELFDYPTQSAFRRARSLDQALFRAGLPHLMDGGGPWSQGTIGRLADAVSSLREGDLVRALMSRIPRPSVETWRSRETVEAYLRWFESLPGVRGAETRSDSVPPSFRSLP